MSLRLLWGKGPGRVNSNDGGAKDSPWARRTVGFGNRYREGNR